MAVVSNLYTYYEATVISATDYYPFGLEMPGRSFQSSSYRFGFNGKENDRTSWSGTQLVQDYGFRLYNPAIGKFLSVDPLTKKYPDLTPYQFASNTPIQSIDLDGLENPGASAGGVPTGTPVAIPGPAPGSTTATSRGGTFDPVVEGDINKSGVDHRHMSLGQFLQLVEKYQKQEEYKKRYGDKSIIFKPGTAIFADDKIELSSSGGVIDKSKSAKKAIEAEKLRLEGETLEDEFIKKHPNASNYLFRSLDPINDKNVEAIGLVARDPSANISVSDHVEGARKSNWISTTSSFSTAWNNYNGRVNGLVAIDISKVRTQIVFAPMDLMMHTYGKHKSIHDIILSMAIKSQEFLIKYRVEKDAIIIIKAPPKK